MANRLDISSDICWSKAIPGFRSVRSQSRLTNNGMGQRVGQEGHNVFYKRLAGLHVTRVLVKPTQLLQPAKTPD